MAKARIEMNQEKYEMNMCGARTHIFTVNARNLFDSGVDGTAKRIIPTKYTETQSHTQSEYTLPTSAKLTGYKLADWNERRRRKKTKTFFFF